LAKNGIGILISKEALWKRIISDYKCQLAAIEGMQYTMGKEFKDPRETRGVQGGGGKFVSLKKDSQLDVPKNMWTIPYLLRSICIRRETVDLQRQSQDG
jgi:hypothetical protein